MSREPARPELWVPETERRPIKKPLTKTDKVYFAVEGTIGLLGLFLYPVPGCALMAIALVIEIQRRARGKL